MNKSKIKSLILAAGLTITMTSAYILPTTTASANVAQVTSQPTSQRLWGTDRYETAIAVSKSGWTKSDTVVLVRGDDFADALAVTPLAKLYNAPILLTGVNSLPSSVQAEITRLGASKVIIAGGTGAVSQGVEDTLKKIATVERIKGIDRYETSVKIAEKLGVKTSVALATGADFADGESIAAVAAEMGMPVIFTEKNTLPEATKKYMADNKVTKTYVIGGNGVISDSVFSAVPGRERLSGANRFETNLAILNKFSNEINFDGVYIATGNDFPDTLTATALAAKNSQCVMLASNSLTQENASFLQGQITPKTVVTLVGGEKVLPSTVVDLLKLDKTDYATDGKTYAAADITGKNINITGKGITVDGATITGNLYVYGNNTTLSNTTVAGTIFLDPGVTGDVTLKNVKAKRIVVRSGASNCVNLDNTISDFLLSQSVNSKPSTKINATGTTAIGATIVQSDISLNCAAGSFGAVSVPASGTPSRSLGLAGTFTGIHLAAPCTFSGSTSPSVYVDAPGVTVGGTVGDLVINTTAAPQFAAGTSIKRIIGTEVSAGVTLTIPSDVKVTEATRDLKLTGSGAGSITVIPPTTPGGSGGTTPGDGGGAGGGGGAVTSKYSITVAGASTSITRKDISDTTVSNLYDVYKSLIPVSGDNYDKIKAKASAELSKLKSYNINGTSDNLVKYVYDKLKASNSGSQLATLINNYSSDPSDTNFANLINYYKEGASFQFLYDLLMNKSSGNITIPKLNGANQLKVTVGSAPYDANTGLDIPALQSNLGITPSTKLSELMTNSSDVKVYLGTDLKAQFKSNAGVLTITRLGGETYTITIAKN